MLTKSGTEPLYAESYLYYTERNGQTVQLVPDSKYVFETEEAMHKDIKLAAEALNMGATKLADRILVDL